jgi:hypothetical protein
MDLEVTVEYYYDSYSHSFSQHKCFYSFRKLYSLIMKYIKTCLPIKAKSHGLLLHCYRWRIYVYVSTML